LPGGVDPLSDSNVEMTWLTFAGEYHEIYEEMIRVRCLKDGLGDDPDTFEEGYFIYQINGDEVSVWEYMGDDDVIIDIPEVVTHEGKEYLVTESVATFWESCIEVINFGSNVRLISEFSFQGRNIREINVSEDNEYYSSVDGVLFNKSQNTLINFPVAKEIDVYEIPASVSSLSPFSFQHSLYLEKVVLNDGLVRIGRWAFGYCSKLEHISSSQGMDVFPTTVALIGDCAFYRCESLNSFSLPEELEVIGSSAFESCGMTEVSLPYNITSIGERTFSNCMNLTEFSFSSGYSASLSIHQGVLYRYSPSSMELLSYPAAKGSETYTLHDETTKIMPGAFAGCSNLKEVILNDNLSTIDMTAFQDCHSLTTIDLKNILMINTSAFDGCENLRDVTFGRNLYYIGISAFQGTAIESVTFGNNLVTTGMEAFAECPNLKEVIISPDCPVALTYNTFYNDNSLKSIFVEGYKATFEEGSLDIGCSSEYIVTVDVYVKEGYSLPDDVGGEFTIVNVIEEGKGPYPYENWIGVFFCVLLIIGILMFVREV
ncbi:MAG: leucine-rich repeat protein, partial [Candidatus Methanomethylophilaceae archaeon]|nr:leucine-rich repeat protein [Candidatus Methanomethylophilaceae archaeon]